MAEETTQQNGGDPWYARPTEAVLQIIGNVSYQTDDYTIASRDGALIIDRTGGETSDQPAAAPQQAAPIMDSIQRVPGIVWVGAAGLLLFTIARR